MTHPHVALVPRDLAALVPAFLRNRRADLTAFHAALALQQGAKLQEIAERIYSNGNPYGFHFLTMIGRRIAVAAQAGNFDEVSELVRAYADYLERVRVEYD